MVERLDVQRRIALDHMRMEKVLAFVMLLEYVPFLSLITGGSCIKSPMYNTCTPPNGRLSRRTLRIMKSIASKRSASQHTDLVYHEQFHVPDDRLLERAEN